MLLVRSCKAGVARGVAAALVLQTISAVNAAPKAKPIDGLKMEQEVVERKKSKPMKATGGTKRNRGGSVPRYHLQHAWPSK